MFSHITFISPFFSPVDIFMPYLSRLATGIDVFITSAAIHFRVAHITPPFYARCRYIDA